jgi:hypothetical protein
MKGSLTAIGKNQNLNILVSKDCVRHKLSVDAESRQKLVTGGFPMILKCLFLIADAL